MSRKICGGHDTFKHYKTERHIIQDRRYVLTAYDTTLYDDGIGSHVFSLETRRLAEEFFMAHSTVPLLHPLKLLHGRKIVTVGLKVTGILDELGF